MFVTGQTATEYTLNVKLLQKVHVHYRSNYYRTYITCRTTTERIYYMSNYYRLYITCQTTKECILHVKVLENVYYMLNYYRMYLTGPSTCTKERTLHVKLL